MIRSAKIRGSISLKSLEIMGTKSIWAKISFSRSIPGGNLGQHQAIGCQLKDSALRHVDDWLAFFHSVLTAKGDLFHRFSELFGPAFLKDFQLTFLYG